MKLKTDVLELRGVKDNISAKGNVYYNIFCEEADGNPCQFYCTEKMEFPKGLNKGAKVCLHLDYNPRFKSLVLEKIEIVNKAEG